MYAKIKDQITTQQQIESIIYTVVANSYRENNPDTDFVPRINNETSLPIDLQFDSLEEVEVCMKLEQVFGMDISTMDMTMLKGASVGEYVEYICKRKGIKFERKRVANSMPPAVMSAVKNAKTSVK